LAAEGVVKAAAVVGGIGRDREVLPSPLPLSRAGERGRGEGTTSRLKIFSRSSKTVRSKIV
jgi:hypothetical protein